MVNLYGSAQQINGSQGGFLTPRFGYQAGQALQEGQTQTSLRYGTQGRAEEDPWWLTVGASLAGAPVDVVDSLAALTPWAERGQVNDKVYESVGMSGYADWVRRNHGSVEVASGILGMVVGGIGVEMAATKLVGSAWFASTGLGTIVRNSAWSVDNARKAASSAMIRSAQAGQPYRWYQNTSGWQSVLANAGNVATKTAVSESAMMAALSQNSFIWSEDMGDNVRNWVLGVGIGGAIGGIMARGQIQKWANSPRVVQEIADVYDPTTLERGMNAVPLGGGNPYSFRPSAEVTANAIIATRDTTVHGKVGTGMARASDQAAIQTRRQVEIMRGFQKIGTRGIDGVAGTKFSVANATGKPANAVGKHLQDAIQADPTLVYGLDEMGVGLTSRTADDLVTQRIDAQKAILADKNSTKMQRAIASHRLQQTSMTLFNKVWVPTAQADDLISFKPDQVRVRPTAKNAAEVRWESPSNPAMKMTLDEQGTLSREFESLSTHQQLEVAEAATQWLGRMQNTKTTMILKKDADWLQLDLAAEYMKRGGAVDFKHHPKMQTLEQVQIAALARKGEKIKDLKELDYKTRIKFNLPQATYYERIVDPHGEVLKRISKAAAVEGATLDEIKNARKEVAAVLDLTEESALPLAIDGQMLQFNRASDGKWYEPTVGFFDDVPTNHWTKTNLKEMLQESSATQHLFMTSKAISAPMVGTLAKVIESHPMRQAAGDISGLDDAMLQSTANIGSQVAGQFLTAAHKNRNVVPVLAAQQINQEVRRVKDAMVEGVMSSLAPISDKLRTVAGKKSATLLNQYLSLANSFDIADAVQLPNGQWAFRLDMKSDINREWMGRYPQPDEYLRNPATGNIAVLDDLANAGRMAMEQETKRLLKEVNAYRISQGLSAITERKFFAPPRSTAGKVVGFTLDSANRVVRGKAIIADTPEEFAKIAAEIRTELKPEFGYKVMTSEQIREFSGLWEEVGLDFIDPTSVAKPSRPRAGTLSADRINPQAWDDSLGYLKNGYDQLMRGMLEAKFSGPVKTARVRSASQIQVRGDKPGVKNIWDTYNDALFGVNPATRQVGVNPVFSKTEEVIDRTISQIWGPGKVGVKHVADLFLRAGRQQPRAAKTFDELSQQLKDHIPFKHVSDFIEYDRGIQRSPTVRGIAQGLNRLSAGIILRWLEVPHAAMNLLGVVTAMPGMMGARNLPTIGRVKGTPIVDSAKILGLGFKDMLSASKHGDWKYMVDMGYTGESFAHMHMQLSTVDSHNKFTRLFVGDPAAAARNKRSGKGVKDADYWRGKGVEGVISALTDTSENMSRVWAHFVGLRMADYHGVVGMEARHRFAKQISDDAIANYDPLNRPEIYQSAFGSMYGLFLSYAQNYHQRLFRYLEDGDFKAIGRTMATQASLFGINSLPGSKQLAAMIGGEEDGDGFLDGIYQRYGSAAGSVIANGGVNQLTTMFNMIPGIDIPAISIHSRGDVNFRHPTSDSILTGQIKAPVGVEVLMDLIQGVTETVSKTVDPNNPMSGRHAAEILARHMPNRTLKGLMVVHAAGGQEADAYGNMMAETQGWAESLYRSLGLRSARQQSEIEAYFLNRQAQAIEGQRMDKLRQATRALIRGGSYDRLPEVFDDYIAAGGKPWNYGNWLQDQIRTAQETRTQNQLQQFLKSPGNQVLANRIQLFTGQ